jgi:cytochrome P450 PksS
MAVTATDPFDIFSPESRGNHQLYEQMRLNDPVHCAVNPHTGHHYWFLTRYDDCVNFMKDKRFGKEFRAQLPSDLSGKWAPTDTFDIINRHMLNLDDPDHNRLKSLVHKAFTPNRIQNLRPRLKTIAQNLLEAVNKDVAGGDEFDLVERYAGVLPVLSIAEMLGVPSADHGRFSEWAHAMLSLSDEQTDNQPIVEFAMYLHQQIDLRRGSPHLYDDLLTGLIFAEDMGDRLSRQELLAMVFLILSAGLETMVNFISNGVLSLFENPEQMRLLRDNLDNPIIVKSAIEEMLRYNGPSYMTLPSWAFEDVEISGKLIRQGDVVHAALHAANRDPTVFENPHTFDIMRSPNKHIAFSQGIHHCLGAPLARLQGEIAITTLLRWMPGL